MAHHLTNVLLGSLALLAAGQALALGPNTTTQVRCLYKVNNTSTDPNHDYVWARTPGSSTTLYKLSGNWWKSGTTSVKNMFFTATTQATLKSVCQGTFTKMGITQPLMMMGAADTIMGVNYAIWTNDAATQAAKISKVIVFGDSVSDNQNVYSTTHWEVPSPHSYFLGRFTNGKVWNEYLSDALGVHNINWAVGGAAADDYYVIPGVVSQVQSYLEYMKSAPNYKPANTLFTVLVGANDLISYGRTVDTIIANETSALESLIASGAKNILVLNVPDLSVSPKFSAEMGLKTPAEREKLRTDVLELDNRLIKLQSDLKLKYPTVNLQLFDTKAMVNRLLANPAQYGITNTTQSCLNINDDSSMNYAQTQSLRPGCTNADAYLFWDLLHPTTRAHQLIANEVIPFVRSQFPVN